MHIHHLIPSWLYRKTISINKLNRFSLSQVSLNETNCVRHSLTRFQLNETLNTFWEYSKTGYFFCRINFSKYLWCVSKDTDENFWGKGKQHDLNWSCRMPTLDSLEYFSQTHNLILFHMIFAAVDRKISKISKFWINITIKITNSVIAGSKILLWDVIHVYDVWRWWG